MRIVLIGGHFSPALALFEELKEKADCIVMGRKYAFEADTALSFEYQTCKEKNIRFMPITSGRLQRKITKYMLSSILKLPVGFLESYKALKEIRPDIVVGFGGYLSVPIVICAKLLGISIVLHEQTTNAGLANRIMAPFAKRICISFASSSKYFPEKKTILTGNPLRHEIFEVKDKISFPKGKVIYVTGGSAGSHFINQILKEVLPILLKRFVIIHQTGESAHHNDFYELEEMKNMLSQEIAQKYIIKKYVSISEIGWVYKNSDLVIARAGINTVSELLALRKLCLLIPLPHGQKNEQENNAKLVKNSGIGQYLLQKNMTPKVLVDKIYSMFENKENNTSKNEDNIYLIKNASKRLAYVIQSVYEKELTQTSSKTVTR